MIGKPGSGRGREEEEAPGPCLEGVFRFADRLLDALFLVVPSGGEGVRRRTPFQSPPPGRCPGPRSACFVPRGRPIPSRLPESTLRKDSGDPLRGSGSLFQSLPTRPARAIHAAPVESILRLAGAGNETLCRCPSGRVRASCPSDGPASIGGNQSLFAAPLLSAARDAVDFSAKRGKIAASLAPGPRFVPRGAACHQRDTFPDNRNTSMRGPGGAERNGKVAPFRP